MTANRWTDERLDDRFGVIEARLKRVEGIPDRMVALEAQVVGMRDDQAQCLGEVRSINGRLTKREEERQRELKLQATERKSDRRWLVGSLFTASGLVIAAISLLADKL